MSGFVPSHSVEEVMALARFNFTRLSTDDAVNLGMTAITVIRESGLNLAVEVRLGDVVAFHAKLGDTGIANEEWLMGKAAVARHFGEPSLLLRLQHRADGTDFSSRDDVDHALFRAYGGSIPLWVDSAVVGTLTVSGEPDDVDHVIAVECVRRYHAARNRED